MKTLEALALQQAQSKREGGIVAVPCSRADKHAAVRCSPRTRLAKVALASATVLIACATAQAAPSNGQNHRWYVSAAAAPGGDGTIHSPFNALAAVQQVSSPGDT